MATLFAAVVLSATNLQAEGDATGATMMTVFGRLTSPAVADSSADLGFQCLPAPFGLVELTESAFCVNVDQISTLFGVSGMFGGGWYDVSLHASRRWMIAPAFYLGTALRLNQSGASGFRSQFGVAATVHALVYLTEEWTLAAGADEVLAAGSWVAPPSGSLRFGVGWRGPVRASANLRITPGRATSLIVAVLGDVIDHITLTGGIETEPLVSMLGLRLHSDAIWPITLQVRFIHNVGLRSVITVELP